MVVMKLVVKEPSEKRKRRQLLPTPGTFTKRVHERERERYGKIMQKTLA